MSGLFKRNSTIRCFFCQAAIPLPQNIKNFKCPSCACWNRYDDKGDIVSDELAMHDEHLNSRSFAKRGSPSKNSLPNHYGPGPFCQSCQTNQMLLVNLLSNYLPEPASPEYESRLEMLSAYRESLHARYPPVCETCLPLVEDELRRKEHMARVKALGGWLSKGKERQRRVSNEVQQDNLKVIIERLFWWRVRGRLWALSALVSLVGNMSAVLGLRPFHAFFFLQPVLPFIVVISLLWTAWDPTYAKFQLAQQQSRDVRIQGKYAYKVLQMSVWASRLVVSTTFAVLWFRPNHEAILRLTANGQFFLIMFFIELFSLMCSAVVLRIHYPPSIRLVDTGAHKFDKSRSGTPAPSGTPYASPPPSAASSSRLPSVIPENDMLATLSLSSKPVIINSHQHVFGQPSLKSSSPVAKEEPNDEEMDWIPTNSDISSTFGNIKRTAASLVGIAETENWLRPQRFFPPEKPTGLEGLFESAQIQDDLMAVDAPNGGQRLKSRNLWDRLTNHLRRWDAFYFVSVAVLVASITKVKWPL